MVKCQRQSAVSSKETGEEAAHSPSRVLPLPDTAFFVAQEQTGEDKGARAAFSGDMEAGLPPRIHTRE